MVAAVTSVQVFAPVDGRAVRLADVPDPVFSAGMVGYGAAIDPVRGVVEALAPVTGKLVRLMPHAYVVLTAGGVGVLVHLGLDTATRDGAFTAHLTQGQNVTAGQKVITYDVAAVVAAGLDPVVPVVVMDERDVANVAVSDAVHAGVDIVAGAELFTRTG